MFAHHGYIFFVFGISHTWSVQVRDIHSLCCSASLELGISQSLAVYATCRLSATVSDSDSNLTALPLHLAHLHCSMLHCASVHRRAMPPVSDSHQTGTAQSTVPWFTALSWLDGPSAPLPGLVYSAAPLEQSSPKHRHSPTQFFTHFHLDVRQTMLGHWSQHDLKL